MPTGAWSSFSIYLGTPVFEILVARHFRNCTLYLGISIEIQEGPLFIFFQDFYAFPSLTGGRTQPSKFHRPGIMTQRSSTSTLERISIRIPQIPQRLPYIHSLTKYTQKPVNYISFTIKTAIHATHRRCSETNAIVTRFGSLCVYACTKTITTRYAITTATYTAEILS